MVGNENNMFRTAVKWTLMYFYIVGAVIVVGGGVRAAFTVLGIDGFAYLDLRTELFPICAGTFAGWLVCIAIAWFRRDIDDDIDIL